MFSSLVGASREGMECLMFSKNSGKTSTAHGTWDVQPFAMHKDVLQCTVLFLALWAICRHEIFKVCSAHLDSVLPLTLNCNTSMAVQIPLPDVLGSSTWHVQYFICNKNAPYKRVTPDMHTRVVGMALKRAGIVSDKKGHDGRKTKPNEMVAKFGTDPELLKNAGW